MRTGSKAAAAICAAALIIPIALAPSCSTGQNLNETQTEPEQNLNRIQTEIEKAILTGENAMRQNGADNVSDDAESLTVGSSEGFALWVRGRLALSSGTGSDELVFEVDPATGRTRAWTSLAVDGAVTVAGDLAARGAAVSGTLRAHTLEATRAALDSVLAGSVESGQLLADEVEAGSVEGNVITARQMMAEAIAVRSADAAELVAGKLEARDAHVDALDAGSLSASSGRVDALESLRASIADLVATAMSVQSLSGEAVAAADVHADRIGGASVEAAVLQADALSCGALDASSAVLGEVSAGVARIDELACRVISCSSAAIDDAAIAVLEASSVDIASLEADEIQAGNVKVDALDAGDIRSDAVTATRLEAQLSSVRPGAGFAGIAVFPAFTDEDVGVAIVCEIETDPRVDGLVVTPSSRGGCPCSWEVEELGKGRWAITRMVSPEAVRMIEYGELESPGETEVYWLAFDLE